MTPEDWQRVKELCQHALDRQPEERIAFLASACPDERIRREVEGLLAHATEGAGIMVPLWNQTGIQVGDTLPFVRDEPGIPPAIGPYRLLERVGEGGMGVVYKAVQDRPHRVVALKVIKPGLTTSELLRRFEREADALARLQHPGIAQIYEVGTVESGVGSMPYFAMEYIDGSPLRSYADSHRLDAQQRLELIARVCDAVEHAHQRGIIHRDLKPGNILLDESGQPKILDFGVARITDRDDHVTRQTDIGQVIGTLAYMSPEQVLADPFELDTRSDVYALGVILYELLAARLPYRVSGTLIDAARAIQEQEPARLGAIDRRYRGDVETIAAMALEKNKERRYASAAALGADIRRYLKHEPIEARPATTSYQLRKFARRHRALVASTAVVFAVLIAGIAFSTRAAAKARAAELTAQAVNDFLRNDLLAQANVALQSGPAAKPDPDLKVRTALDRAAAQISGKFEGQPAVEAAVRDTIGLTYLDLGIYAPARTQLERALDLHRRIQGDKDPETLRTLSRLARTAFFESKYPEAERLFTQAMDAQRRVLGAEHADTLASMTGLATVYDYAGKHTLAEELIRTVLDVQRRSLGPDDPSVLRAMSTLEGIYISQGKYAEGESSGVQLLAADRRVLGTEHPETLAAMNNLANVYLLRGKYTQAEALYGETLQIYRRVFGTENSKTLSTLQNLANAYGMLGKYAAAEAVLRESLEIQRRVTGPEHSDTLHAMVNLADALYLQGKYDAAEKLLNEVLDVFRRTQGPEHPRTLIVLADMALMYQLRGTYDLAEKNASAALTGRRRALGVTHPATIASAADLALALVSQGKYTDSESLAREAVEFTRKNQPDDWERYRAESLLGASLAGQQKFADAEPLLVDGYQGMLARKERMGVPNWYYLDRAGEWVLQLYQAWGKPARIAEWRRKLKS